MRRDNPATPLPEHFPPEEFGLMTREEFIQHLNPKGTRHGSDSYQTTISDLNPLLPLVAPVVGRTSSRQQRGSQGQPDVTVYGFEESGSRFLVFEKAGRIVAVQRDGRLYKDRFFDFDYLSYRRSYEDHHEPITYDQLVEVKYPAEFIVPIGDRNRAAFPHVLQRTLLGGEHVEVRSKAPPRPNRQDDLVVLNARGQIVAMASDEWGATLLRVVEEYRGRGLGRLLLRHWFAFNPRATSGGFTWAGEQTSLSLWQARVREFLARGWYSELVKQGRLSGTRVNAILAGLASTSGRETLPDIERVRQETRPEILVYTDGEVFFVVYDARFLVDPREDYILGYGFFRSTDAHGSFLYRIEHERPYAWITTAIALQIARDQKEPIYVEGVPADIVEWQTIHGATYEDGYISLDRDILNLDSLIRYERAVRRRAGDPYGEKATQLLETAEAKWS